MIDINNYITEKFRINKETISKASNEKLFSHIMEVINTVPMPANYENNSKDIEPLIRYWLNGYNKDTSFHACRYEFSFIGNLEYNDLSIYLSSNDDLYDKVNICKGIYYKSSKKKVHIREIDKSDKFLTIYFNSFNAVNPIVLEKDLL